MFVARFDDQGNLVSSQSYDNTTYPVVCTVQDNCYYIKCDGQKIVYAQVQVEGFSSVALSPQVTCLDDMTVVRINTTYGIAKTSGFSAQLVFAKDDTDVQLKKASDVFTVRV